MTTPSQAHVSGGLPEEAGDAATPKLVNLSADDGPQGGQRLRRDRPRRLARDGSRAIRSASSATTAASSAGTSCASPACGRSCWSRPPRTASRPSTSSPTRRCGCRTGGCSRCRPCRCASSAGSWIRTRWSSGSSCAPTTPTRSSSTSSSALRTDFAPMLGIRGIVPVDGPEPDVEPVPDGVRFAATRARRRLPSADGHRRPRRRRCARTAASRSGCGSSAERRDDRARATTCTRATIRRARRGARDRTAARPALGPVGPRVVTDDKLFDRVLERSLQDLRMLALAARRAGLLRGRRPLVRHAVRPRLADHRDRDASPSTRAWPSARCACSRACSGPATTPPATRSPARSCTSCASARSRAAASRRSRRYYGTVDATPLFLCLLAEHADWSGDLALFRELRGEVEQMLGWIDGPGDRNRDGLLEYAARTPDGLRNQGWKDSARRDHGRRRRRRSSRRSRSSSRRATWSGPSAASRG